jgi:hypothetical protein
MKRYLGKTISFLLALTCYSVTAVKAADKPPVDEGWPRQLTSKGMTAVIHEPQVESWDGFNLKAHAAVSVRPTVKQEPVYGVMTFTAKTLVDKTERIVSLEDLEIAEAKFPSTDDQGRSFLPVLQLAAKKKVRNIALDRLEASLAVADQVNVGESVPVRNDAPQIIFANKPAVLIYIDGDPHFTPIEDTDGALQRVINTRVLLLKDRAGKYYLHLFDGYMEAPALEGPWTVSMTPPADLKKAEKAARASGQVDLMEVKSDSGTKAGPSLKSLSPLVYVSSRPSELIVTEGEPNFAPIAGTDLLYVTNTTGNVFKSLKDNKTYVLLAGRWFRAASLSGPWEFVPHKNLPADFARIPDDSPKENVKASVPGTPEAREALIANSIPQTAKVSRDNSGFAGLVIDGEPKMEFIEGTPLSYVVNCSTPVIKVDENSWYAVQNGIWYVATSLEGPWVIADAVPEVIYSIPVSSPLHYVTYVRVYGASPKYVYVGYTPGYLGTVVNDNVVVYGTGYYYTPWIGTYWYGPPVTYGLGVSIGWTPWWGWGWGFGWGWGWGALSVGWAYHGWYGRPAWGPHGWACTSTNAYYRGSQWYRGGHSSPYYNSYTRSSSAGRYGTAYNSRTGALLAGQRGSVKNVYTNRYSADARGNVVRIRPGQPAAGSNRTRQGGMGGNQVFGSKEGRVYRSSSRGTWQSVNQPGRGQRNGATQHTRDFTPAQQARQLGQQRYQSFQANRPSAYSQPSRPSGGYNRGGSGPSPGISRPSGGGSWGGGSRGGGSWGGGSRGGGSWGGGSGGGGGGSRGGGR